MLPVIPPKGDSPADEDERNNRQSETWIHLAREPVAVGNTGGGENELPDLEDARAELARRMRVGDAVIMDEAPLFDRIMGGLVSKMRSAPAPH